MDRKLVSKILLFGLVAFFVLPVLPGFCADQTQENLKIAYNTEFNENANYLAFAEKAKEEGYMDVYRLFMAAAKSEEIRAKHHGDMLTKLGVKLGNSVLPIKVKTTKENLESLLQNKTYEVNKMYPDFIKQAGVDKDDKLVMFFNGALVAEAQHLKYFSDALKNLDNWKNSGKVFMVCAKCSYTTDDFSLKACPVCGAQREQFIEFK